MKPTITKPLDHHAPDPKNAVRLALEFKDMIYRGVVNNQSELAERICFNRARITQILNLLKLAKYVVWEIAAMDDPHEWRFLRSAGRVTSGSYPRPKQRRLGANVTLASSTE